MDVGTISSKKVKMFLLNMDCTNKDTGNIVNALLHSIQRVHPLNIIMRIYGQCTDSGFGGTKLTLFQALKSRNVTLTQYLIYI